MQFCAGGAAVGANWESNGWCDGWDGEFLPNGQPLKIFCCTSSSSSPLVTNELSQLKVIRWVTLYTLDKRTGIEETISNSSSLNSIPIDCLSVCLSAVRVVGKWVEQRREGTPRGNDCEIFPHRNFNNRHSTIRRQSIVALSRPPSSHSAIQPTVEMVLQKMRDSIHSFSLFKNQFINFLLNLFKWQMFHLLNTVTSCLSIRSACEALF